MKKEQLQDLLDKYYKAETNLQEEETLREELQGSDDFAEEKDVFTYFREEAFVPQNLENTIFNQITAREPGRKKIIRMYVIRAVSVAAMVVLFISIFLLRPGKVTPLKLSQDEQFAVLEQALSQVSYCLQPSEDDDLVVVFQDKNFEIVMN